MAHTAELSQEQVRQCSPAYDIVRQFRTEPTELFELGQDNLGNRFYAKDETDNVTGAYKWRGSVVALSELFEQGETRVVTASAGNHGQGIAWASKELDGTADVFVPIGTPQSKLDGLQRLGARIYLVGNSYEEATAHAMQHATDLSTHYVPAFDDLNVMRGQGTIADELVSQFIEQRLYLEDTVLFVPVGGGGLLGGIAERMHELTGGKVKLVGVQITGSDSAAVSFGNARNCSITNSGGAKRIHSPQETGEIVRINASEPNDDCDATRVRLVGELCLPKIVKYVHEFLVVEPNQLGEYYRQNPGSNLEPAGALAQVGANLYSKLPGASLLNLVALQTGRNQDPARIQHLMDLAA